MMRLFCFGLGFSARLLAQTLMAERADEGWSVAGTCRSADKRDRLRAQGITAHLFDRGRPLDDAAEALAGTTHLVLSAPPDGEGDPVLDHHGAEIAGLPSLRWVGYLSTVGVYGDHQGGWVDETAPLNPSTERGRRRVAAEQGWLELWSRHDVPVHLFRLAGIYGPGRSAIDDLRAGRAKRIDKPGQVFNRIHVADIVAIVRASMARPNPGAAYNCADDLPVPGHEVVDYAAGLLGLPPPPMTPFVGADLSVMARSFYAENKRITNRRIKEELGVTLAYPTYAEGLTAILAASPNDSQS